MKQTICDNCKSVISGETIVVWTELNGERLVYLGHPPQYDFCSRKCAIVYLSRLDDLEASE